MLKIKNSRCSNHLISNQADFSLEALKKCFIYKYGRNKKPLRQTRKSQNIARTREKNNTQFCRQCAGLAAVKIPVFANGIAESLPAFLKSSFQSIPIKVTLNYTYSWSMNSILLHFCPGVPDSSCSMPSLNALKSQ